QSPTIYLRVTTVSIPLLQSGRDRSSSSSSSFSYSAALPSPAPICVFTKSATVVPAATCLLEPSGSVICSVSDMTNLYNAKGPAREPGLPDGAWRPLQGAFTEGRGRASDEPPQTRDPCHSIQVYSKLGKPGGSVCERYF